MLTSCCYLEDPVDIAWLGWDLLDFGSYGDIFGLVSKPKIWSKKVAILYSFRASPHVPSMSLWIIKLNVQV
jgi:hypothetical protein